MGTRTGNFAIGFRRGWSDWQKDLKGIAQWAKATGFDRIDLGKATKEDIGILKAAGLDIGSADLQDFTVHTDAGKRKEVQANNVAYIKEAAAAGAKVFFSVIIPGDGSKSRADNHKQAVEFYAPLCEAADSVGAKIALEGWPGGGNLPNLACNPESYRLIIKDLKSKSIGINYDPSHLIRMGIDHLRFVKEFADRVWHVHGKDTEVFNEVIYELGYTQTATHEKGHGFGEHTWRYTIPGHGCSRWVEIFKTLKAAKFNGAVCVELEDENFNGTEDGEKAALIHSLNFLRSA